MGIQERVQDGLLKWLWDAIELAKEAGDEEAVRVMTDIYRYLTKAK